MSSSVCGGPLAIPGSRDGGRCGRPGQATNHFELESIEALVEYEVQTDIDLTPSRGARVGGVAVVLTTVLLYVVFW